MIHLLLTLVFAEMALILTLLFGTPLRKLLMMGLDKLKQGRGLLVAQTVAAIMVVVFASTLYSLTKIHKHSVDSGVLNPTNEVLMAHRLLEASLMGFTLLLAIMIDRLHYYMKELLLVRRNLDAVKDYENKKSKKVEALEAKLRQLESNSKSNPTKKIGFVHFDDK